MTQTIPIRPVPIRPNPTKPIKSTLWSKSYSAKAKSGNIVSIQKCVGNVNDCKNNKTSTTKWMSCKPGSSPAGLDPNNKSICTPYSTGKYDFNCIPGQNCYAISSLKPPVHTITHTPIITSTPTDVTWGPSLSGCDSSGNNLTIQSCTNWINNAPSSCNNSPTKPNAIKWINCAIGSSPGGIDPNNQAILCSPLSSGPSDFPCVVGQNCYAVTAAKSDATCASNTIGQLNIGISVIAIILIILLIAFIIYYIRNKQ